MYQGNYNCGSGIGMNDMKSLGNDSMYMYYYTAAATKRNPIRGVPQISCCEESFGFNSPRSLAMNLRRELECCVPQSPAA